MHVVSKSYYRSFLKDNAVVISGHVLVYLKGIILIPIIIKSAGASIYGGFVLLTSVLGIAYGISSFGTGFRLKRFMPSALSMAERSDLFYPQFLFNLLSILGFSTLFVLLEKPLNAYIFKNNITYSIWIIPLYLITYLLFSQGTNYFRYTNRIQYLTLVSICFPYLHIGFVLLCYYVINSISINILLGTYGLASLVIAIPIFWVILKEIGAKITFYTTTDFITDIKTGFPLVLGFIVDFVLAVSDRYVIAFYLTLSDVGYYTAGYVLGSLIVFIPKAMCTALPQLLCRALDNGNESAAHTMSNYALKIYLLVAIPFVFGGLALAKPVLIICTNADIAQNAFLVIPVVALGTLFYGLNLILSDVMFVCLKTKAIFKMNAIAALFNISANIILFHFYKNIMVAAVTTVLSYSIAFYYSYRIVIKDWPLSFYPGTIIKSIIASAAMCIMLFWLSAYFQIGDTFFMILGRVILGIIIYTLLLFALSTFTREETKYLKSIFLN